MNFANFSRAISYIGLDLAPFESYRAPVNTLVRLRHDCAHGESITFDRTKSDRDLAFSMFHLQASIVTLMHALSVELVDHFEEGRYCVA